MNTNRPERTTADGEEWLVVDVTRRTVWSTETTPCTECGTTLELDRPHHYVTLQPTPSSAATDRRRYPFCSAECLDAWL